ncbi:MAG: glycosyltransferase family 39 protein [Deltaproteobacteria bacterium]|nr:glycosyltransferase family 39 protein [Deltaproteobacteria bacterium]
MKRPLTISAATVAVWLAVALPGGPFAFLPAALRWPLALLLAVALWLPQATERGGERVARLAASARLPATLEALALVAIFGTYVLLKVPGLHASGTDENVYFYLAARVSQGAVPYRDFFFSHPPVHLLVPALVFKVLGFSLPVAKAIPALAQGLAGLFLYLTARRASRGFALAALAFHLGAYQVLMGSTDMNGENLLSAFLLAALLAAVRGRFLLAGCLAGLAVGAGLYGLAGVLALALATGFASRRALARFLVGWLAVFGGLLLVFGLLGGRAFFDGVFAYHLAKPPKDGRLSVFAGGNPIAMVGAYLHNLGVYVTSKVLRRTLYWDAPAHLAAVIAAGLLVGQAIHARLSPDARAAWRSFLSPRDLLAGTPAGLARLGFLAAVCFFAQWAALGEVYDFYQVPMLCFVALAAGYPFWVAFRLAREARGPVDLRLPALLTALFALHLPMAEALNRHLWPEEAREAGEVVGYEWRQPVTLGALATASRALYFADQRVKGARTPAYRHYLWNKLLTFSSVDEVARHVRERTAADETVTGASMLAPLVALQAGRRVAADEADTNYKRFSSGMLTEEAFLQRACRDRVRYLVSSPRSYFTAQLMTSSPALRRSFAVERQIVDPQLTHGRGFPITLYRRRDLPGLPAGVVCAPR